jgi:hypothetical protein
MLSNTCSKFKVYIIPPPILIKVLKGEYHQKCSIVRELGLQPIKVDLNQ